MNPVTLLLLCGSAWAAVDSDLVTSLPGYDGMLPTKHYSGMIPTKHPTNSSITVFHHYWLVEAQAPLDPKTAPTIVWMQGGPGGSSLIGLLTENGPITLNDYSTRTAAFNSTKIPTVFTNDFSWNILGNILYVEHPAPTGFSYCTGYDDSGFQCPPWDDGTQADSSYRFFVKFFSEKYFPELKNNDFWFSGESYAGVLVPTLSERLLAARTPSNADIAPYSVRGFALGNDCPGNRVYTCTPYSGWIGTRVALDFRFRHGMINESLYKKINQVCQGQWDTFESPGEECAKLLEDPVRPVLSSAGDTYQMGGGYYLYDTCDPDLLSLDIATSRPRLTAGKEYTVEWLLLLEKERKREKNKQRGKEIEVVGVVDDAAVEEPAEYDNNAGTYACGQERNSLVWLNLEAVRKAIHVPTKEESGRTFDFSTGLPGYNFTAHSLLDLYNDTLIPNLTIMQYSGDADPCVPYIGTERWIESLHMPVVQPWRPWKSGTEIAGYTTTYLAEGNDPNHFFDFVTVRNAGHMVPRYKPASALHMMANFLNKAGTTNN